MSSMQKEDITPTREVTVSMIPKRCGGCHVLQEQLGLVCYQHEQKIIESRQWNSQEKACTRGSPAKMDDFLSVEMSISQAPPSFRKPVTQKKACTPPFKVQISVCFGKGCSQLPVKVNAYSLTKDSLASFLKQASQNSLATLPSDSGLVNASIYKCLENHQSNKDDLYNSVQESFEFVDMQFKTSSRMGLRWLVFVARVHDDFLYCIYKRPTIVLSRKTDQYCKACCILANDHPILEITDGSSLTTSQTLPQSSSSCNKEPAGSPQSLSVPNDAKEWILAAYNECHFSRGLTLHDLGFLGVKLGIRGLTMHSMGEPWYLSQIADYGQRFENFANWICPFMVDRSVAEDLLEQEVVGTFLVRISSEPGSFVLSVKEVSCQGEYIEHYLIDALDLKRRSLSSWIMANQSAQLLLDVRSGAKFPKHVIFIESVVCCSSQQPHFINNMYESNSLPANVYPSLVFDSTATDSDGSSPHLNLHKYAHSVFGTS